CAGDTERLTLVPLGTTSDGLSLGVAIVGAPAPSSLDPFDGLFIVASQHGFEPAPREAALRLIRDLCYSEDPEVEAALTRPVAVVYNANPYGSVEFVRFNSL